MELPSMVQRSGDTLIVRSVVSGNQLYMDQGANSNQTSNSNNNNNNSNNNNNNNNTNAINNNNNNNNSSNTKGVNSPTHYQQQHHHSSHNGLDHFNASALEMYRSAAVAAQQQQQQHSTQHYLQQQQQGATQQTQQANAAQQATAAVGGQGGQHAALELRDEGLPQCKIKRNYSCSYCSYFTQNPRYHLTHLRDVHGEKIVINKCKLCLYASRHFQKLVRHMKMVHGCTDGITGGHGQARGKRGMSREARKRKLEASVGLGTSGGGGGDGGGFPVKREMGLPRAIQAYSQQLQEEQQQKQQAAEALFAAAYERELQAQRDRELEALQAATRHSAYENDVVTITSDEMDGKGGYQITPPSVHATPSPTGSISPSGVASTPNSSSNSAALSLSFADEPAQNRLLKCSVCDYTTLYRAQLVGHEAEEHYKTKFFRCEKCSYVTHIKTRFSKHVKYHSMPMIKCVTCDFRTPYKWNLDRHMKNHGGAGPFKCAACDFTADIKQSLTVHEMNHHVPPVGHAAGMSLARRRNKVGGTDLCDDFLSDSAELDDHYNNNNLDDYDEAMLGGAVDDGEVVVYGKKAKYDDDEPTDLSHKGGSSDTSSVHNHQQQQQQSLNGLAPKAKRPIPNLIPIAKPGGSSVLNLSKDLAASRHSLSEIAAMFFNEKQLSEMLQPLNKSDAAQLSPTTTVTSASSQASRSQLHKRTGAGSGGGGSFFDKLKSSAMASGGPSENLICPCGHVAKCLSESIIHRKTCNFAAIAEDDIEEEQDDGDGRLEIDFADDDERQSHSALNLSVPGSTRCQHCRHRCKSSADLLNHLKQCTEALRNESYDSLSGESSAGRGGGADSAGEQHHPMENRVFIWNKMPRSVDGSSNAGNDGIGGEGTGPGGTHGGSGMNDENSYYGVETAPGYGEVTKKMTPEEEAANSSLKKVYKCPHCSFWASTASRFHVHIVGHLNKKPFECSLCSYRSNWRWDITKHIRLKTIRDPSHKNARVLMNDETGRRNYTKYNKYITLMKVTEEDGDPKLMKSGEMTPHQVASLSFLNDYHKSGGTSGGGLAIGPQHLNGIKEDITLEPVLSAKSGDGDGSLSDNYIRLPLLATMMNAMTMKQQQQRDQEQHLHHATLITPSVTISAVKRSPPHLIKPSDDLVTDVKQEGNEKKTFYKCRKCTFRHGNRDAVLAHVRIHYQDGTNYPIVTATPSNAPKAVANAAATPLQVAVNPNHYMNKVLAMCLSHQQQSPNNNSSSNSASHQQQHQQHSMLSAGLLQQAIQQSGHNSIGGGGSKSNATLSGLALALAGKTPNKAAAAAAAASILEHGEQKSTQNEASAEQHQQQQQQQQSPVALGGGGGGGVGGSLQHLLTSPRATTSAQSYGNHNNNNNSNSNNNSNKNSLVLGLTSHTHTGNAQQSRASSMTATTAMNSAARSSSSPSTAADGAVTVTTLPTKSTTTTSLGSFGLTGAGGMSGAAVTAATAVAALSHGTQQAPQQRQQRSRNHNSNEATGGSSAAADILGLIRSSGGVDSICLGGVLYGSNNSILNSPTTTITPSTITSIATTSTSTTSNLFVNNNNNNYNHNNNNNHNHNNNNSAIPATAATSHSSLSSPSCASLSSSSCPSSSFSSSSPPSMSSINNNNNATTAAAAPSTAKSGNSNNNQSNNNRINVNRNSPSNATTNSITNNQHHNLNTHTNNANQNLSNSNGNSNLLSHCNDSERRDPSPYRCGHCHQVSNWKHVIQRHCRLKHAGDILIETLDRSALSAERSGGAPIYRLLGNGATNETHHYGGHNTFKALQEQQQRQQQQANLNNNNNNNNNNNSTNNNNSVLMNKSEALLHSPLTGGGSSATHAPHDLQAAAAAYLAAYKAVAGTTGGAGEDLLQLQQNDQIEITRLPPSNNLAQLLEAGSGNNGGSGGGGGGGGGGLNSQQQNSKCKQQKCPLCPYISESKSQMNYHISLHKPTQYECTLCTFVCAKKQHLSSHMRSVHQQQSGNGAAGGTTTVAGLNLDFSVALQLAAAAQAQQDSAAFTAPLAIDLSALKHTFSAANSPKHATRMPQSVAGAEQPRHVAYCPKCPARFAPKSHSASEARADLKAHLNMHAESGGSGSAYKCEFCDFRAAHETLVQAHRHVHSQHYQDKHTHTHGQEDADYPAPKLMQITLTKNLPAPETVWVVDTELCDGQLKQRQQQQQHANISSSSAGAASGSFDSANSLLKKQLEAGPAPRNSPSPPPSAPSRGDAAGEERDDCSSSHTAPSTVATSDLAGSDSMSTAVSPAPLERCLHCPYETASASQYKAHLQHHACIGGQRAAHACEHCDYTHADRQHIVEEHTRVHFNAMEKLQSVAFFTSYDNLELSVKPELDEEQTAAEALNDEPVEAALPMDTADAGVEQMDVQQEAVPKSGAAVLADFGVKQELQPSNNNNEENAINENTVHEQLQQEKLRAPAGKATADNASNAIKQSCTKIILYKSDGYLSVKKEPQSQLGIGSAAAGNGCENISDRLRRRISRSANALNNTNNSNSSDEPQQQQQISHKTILVNAKTGQVISRN